MTPFGGGGEFPGAPPPPAVTGAVKQAASTIGTGFAMQNASDVTILQYTAPNDGKVHQVLLAMQIIAGAAGSTGGAIVYIYTQGGTQFITSLSGGGLSANQVVGLNANFVSLAVDPGTTVTLQQQTAVTVGAAKVYAALSAA